MVVSATELVSRELLEMVTTVKTTGDRYRMLLRNSLLRNKKIKS